MVDANFDRIGPRAVVGRRGDLVDQADEPLVGEGIGDHLDLLPDREPADQRVGDVEGDHDAGDIHDGKGRVGWG